MDSLGAYEASAWGSPAKRLALAFEDVAVRPHQRAATAPSIATAPKITVKFIFRSFSVLVVS
jgi:hypothetical protein